MTLLLSYVRSDVDSSAATTGTKYSLKLINEAPEPWTFYVYQKAPPEAADVFSLAWFASPYKIQNGNSITFKWDLTYNFVWSDTGIIQPGVTFDAGGSQDADPSDSNTTTFSCKNGPGFSNPKPGTPKGTLVISDDDSVPNQKFSVGIGMSGTGTFVVQAGNNLTHDFTPTPSYWIAAGAEVKVGTVLDIQTVTRTKEVKFPTATFAMKATLAGDHTWEIEPD